MSATDFWNDIDHANEVNKNCATLKKIVDNVENAAKEIQETKMLIELMEENEFEQITNEILALEKKISELEIDTLLNGKFDNCNCYLEIHPGAGGTESGYRDRGGRKI